MNHDRFIRAYHTDIFSEDWKRLNKQLEDITGFDSTNMKALMAECEAVVANLYLIGMNQLIRPAAYDKKDAENGAFKIDNKPLTPANEIGFHSLMIMRPLLEQFEIPEKRSHNGIAVRLTDLLLKFTGLKCNAYDHVFNLGENNGF